MKDITIVSVAYKRPKNIPVLIHSLLAQTLQNFRLVIIHDGYDAEMETLLSGYRDQNPDVIEFMMSEKRYGDYGHSLRDIGIKLTDTEYILLTNDDNYYCPRFLEYMFNAVRALSTPPDVVMCDMIHSHNNPGGRQQLPYQFFETRPARHSIDIGCFIARTELAKKVGFRDKTHDGDATYFEDLIRAAQTPKIVKVPHVLFVHN